MEVYGSLIFDRSGGRRWGEGGEMGSDGGLRQPSDVLLEWEGGWGGEAGRVERES